MTRASILPTSKDHKGYFFGVLATALFAAYLLANRYVYVTYDVDGFSYTITFTLWAGFFALLSVAAGWYRQRFEVFSKHTLPVVLPECWLGLA